MNDGSVVRERTVCPLVVRIGAILLLLSVVLPTGGLILGLVSQPLSSGEWAYQLAGGVLGIVVIVCAVYTLLGRPWAYYMTLVLSLPTVIVPVLLLVGFREYMAYTAHVQMHRERRAALLC